MYRSAQQQNIPNFTGHQWNGGAPPHSQPSHSPYSASSRNPVVNFAQSRDPSARNQGPMFPYQKPEVREFKYDYDFDQNGVLFYLGTIGMARQY